MSLILKNLQTAVKLNMQQIGKETNMIRKLMGIDRVDVTVLFVSDYYMSKLNERFKNTQGPTDLFVFPTLEIEEPGSLPSLNEEMDNLGLGDVFLGPAHIQRQCESSGDRFHAVVMIAEPGSLPSASLNGEDNLGLGDVFLGTAHIQRQCESHGDDFNMVVMATITHGFCHLIGYDHETERQQQLMVKVEGSILESFNKLTGNQCKPLTVVGH